MVIYNLKIESLKRFVFSTTKKDALKRLLFSGLCHLISQMFITLVQVNWRRCDVGKSYRLSFLNCNIAD